MAREKRRREPQPVPPPLPPATRTVGQLVAETIRLYGSRFWRSLALGIAPAAAGLALAESPGVARLPLAFTAAAAAASLAFALATGVVAGERIPRRRLAEATALNYTAPILVTLMAGVFLDERLTRCIQETEQTVDEARFDVARERLAVSSTQIRRAR